MAVTKFDPSIHTPQFFEKLNIEFDSNRTKIAKHLNITRSTLYNWLERTNNLIGSAGMINHISFENLKDHLRNNPEANRNAYLLNEIIRPGKPLRSNTLLIIDAIRDMLKEKK